MSLVLTGERSVWAIARPTGFYKHQPLCRWGILLSPYSKTDLSLLWIAKKPSSSSILRNWGTYIGTCRTSEDTYTTQVIPDFGRQHIVDEWRFSATEYIGVTCLKDSDLLTLRGSDINKPIREHSYRLVEALVNIACPGYRFKTLVQDVSLTIVQFFYSVDVDLDLEPPKSIGTILGTRAAYDEYLDISGFLQDKDDVKYPENKILCQVIKDLLDPETNAQQAFEADFGRVESLVPTLLDAMFLHNFHLQITKKSFRYLPHERNYWLQSAKLQEYLYKAVTFCLRVRAMSKPPGQLIRTKETKDKAVSSLSENADQCVAEYQSLLISYVLDILRAQGVTTGNIDATFRILRELDSERVSAVRREIEGMFGRKGLKDRFRKDAKLLRKLFIELAVCEDLLRYYIQELKGLLERMLPGNFIFHNGELTKPVLREVKLTESD